MPFPFEKLELYKRALTFAGKIEELAKSLRGRVAYPILDQLTRASVSITLNIAEGIGRTSKREKLRFLRIAQGSLFETVAVIQIIHGKNHIDLKVYQSLYKDLEIQAKMITNLSKFLDTNQIH